MFGTIRRHQTWLWAIIIVPMIISFIAYFNPSSHSNGGIFGFLKGGQSAHGLIDGQPITDQQYDAAYVDVAFPVLLSGHPRPDKDSAEVKYEMYRELFLLAKEEQLGIRPTAEAAAELARNLLRGAMTYDDFVDKRLKPVGLGADDFDRYLRHQVGQAQLQLLAGLNGTLVMPSEAETLFRTEHRALVTKFVWFAATNYLHAVTVNPSAVAEFYTNGLATYSVPDQVQVNYVRFDASNYFAPARAAITNLDQVVEDLYARQGTNLVPEAKTPEEAKALAKQELIRGSALKLARRDAFQFAADLDARGNHADDLAKLAKEKNLVLRTTAPFDEETGPADLGLTNNLAADFAKSAFRLTDDAPFSHDFTTENAVYVMGLKKKTPSYIPLLKDIEAKVTSDYRDAQAYQLAAQAATNFTTTIAGELNVNNGVTLPKTFGDICSETGNKAESVPPFSLSTTNLPPELEGRVELPILKRAGFTTQVGSASAPVNVRGGTFILFVEKMMPVDESLVKNGVLEYLALLRQARQNDAFSLWINDQVRRDPDLQHIIGELVKSMRESGGTSSR